MTVKIGHTTKYLLEKFHVFSYVEHCIVFKVLPHVDMISSDLKNQHMKYEKEQIFKPKFCMWQVDREEALLEVTWLVSADGKITCMEPMFPLNHSIENSSGAIKRYSLPQKDCEGSWFFVGPLEIVGKCDEVVRCGSGKLLKIKLAIRKQIFYLLWFMLCSFLRRVLWWCSGILLSIGHVPIIR